MQKEKEENNLADIDLDADENSTWGPEIDSMQLVKVNERVI